MKKFALLLILFFCYSHSLFAQIKIAEYGAINPDNESGVIDILSTEVANKSSSKGLIVVHKGKDMPLGQFLRHYYGIKNYWSARGFPSGKLIMFSGEERKEFYVEMWVIPENAKVPEFKTISLEEKLKEKITKKTLFDKECIECEPPVIINLNFFQEGLDFLAQALKANPDTYALIEIARYGGISGNRKERLDLTQQILDELMKTYKISRNRIKIRFTSGNSLEGAKFYVVPTKTNLQN